MISLAPEIPQVLFAQMLAAASSCFLLVFLAASLMALLPIMLTDPNWQLGVTSSLVNNGGFALISLVLLHLASHLDPPTAAGDPLHVLSAPGHRGTIGFLLIVPLEVFCTLKGIALVFGASPRCPEATQTLWAELAPRR